VTKIIITTSSEFASSILACTLTFLLCAAPFAFGRAASTDDFAPFRAKICASAKSFSINSPNKETKEVESRKTLYDSFSKERDMVKDFTLALFNEILSYSKLQRLIHSFVYIRRDSIRLLLKFEVMLVGHVQSINSTEILSFFSSQAMLMNLHSSEHEDSRRNVDKEREKQTYRVPEIYICLVHEISGYFTGHDYSQPAHFIRFNRIVEGRKRFSVIDHLFSSEKGVCNA